ncbi:MAG: 3-phosphoshikimate 1-carboxyvinyltransferase [Phycisphaerae bacterium SM23_30]|nr:MAG: 3-phosphoshikimate 1-carboxyvinyltransferase [Phycisphaerae bacterium SM23_30]
MKLTATKSVLGGRAAIPGSKSHTIRAVALASLAGGASEIIAPLDSADTRAAVNCYRLLGAEIDTDDSCVWRVKGVGGRLQAPADIIDVANSGTTLRFGLGSAALLREGSAVFTGDEQIRNRPVGPLLDSLNDLGAECFSKGGDGKAPVVVKGRLIGGETSIEAVTSQYLSALLINTPLSEGDTIINVIKLNEKPYIEMTLRYLDEHGVEYENRDFDRFLVRGGQSYHSFSKRMPADFSSATFFFCAGAILEGELVLEGLDFTDTQGDKAVVDILKQMGADIRVEGNEVAVRGGELRGVEVDMNAIPDALPALAAAGCFAKGPMRLYNVAQARLKETDRIAVMAAELSKMGAEIEERPDGLIIRPARLHAAEVSGHHDHRVVMALSLAAMAVEGESVIDTAEAVNVTFPEYVKLMQAVGGKIRLFEG